MYIKQRTQKHKSKKKKTTARDVTYNPDMDQWYDPNRSQWLTTDSLSQRQLTDRLNVPAMYLFIHKTLSKRNAIQTRRQ